MLEELRQKLLSSRDKFILSNRDTLPDLDHSSLMQRKVAAGLTKQGSSDRALANGGKGVSSREEE